MSHPFTFLDLFAGIGGFHAALGAAGGHGVFASDIDRSAAQVYARNWGLSPENDIVPLTDPSMRVPATDVLAAGLPCEPLSKSVHQQGMRDTPGSLFFSVCQVLEAHRPPVIMIENIRGLAGARQQETWTTIVETLRGLGYRVSSTPVVMSPHLLPPELGGRPQFRERVFIVGTYVGAAHSRTAEALAVSPVGTDGPIAGWDPRHWQLGDLLQDDSEIEDLERYRLTNGERAVIDKWNEFLAIVDAERVLGCPIWADELRSPPVIPAETPLWKVDFLRRNARLYEQHASQIDAWRGVDGELLAGLPPSFRKLNWQADQAEVRDLWTTVMHFRPAGILAKPPSYLPAPSAISQAPIYGPRRRRITLREAARLQGLPDWFEFAWPDGTRQPYRASYKQLSTGVSVGAAYWVFRQHVLRDRDLIAERAPHIVEAVLRAPDNPDDRLTTTPLLQVPPRADNRSREVTNVAGHADSAAVEPQRPSSVDAAGRRTSTSPDRQTFLPAASTPEAVQRIFALTGRAPDGTRGEKRALVALRDALGVDVEIARTNAALGQELAKSLSIEWVPARFTERNTVTLEGLNALLEGAVEARRVGSLERLKDLSPDNLTGPAWQAFRPARSKIEAVTRIAALTNAPRERLGPGSKERKSVLLNLANALFPDGDINKSSKTRLGASLAAEFGVPWNDRCESTGQTVSLLGLNTILAGAERHLGLLGSEVADSLRTAADEGSALAAALLDGLPDYWDGKRSVSWLAERGLRGANDNEWQGFYGEERAKLALNQAFSPPADPPVSRFANTPFDYALNRVWDIKVHTEVQVLSAGRRPGGNTTQLNDETAIRLCVEAQGLGFLTVSGEALMDETGDFVTWHRQFKKAPPAPSNSGRSTVRKAGFRPLLVEAFWVENTEALHAALLAGQLKILLQGRQSPRGSVPGAARPNKFGMQMRQARQGLRVARYDWPEAGA